MKKTLLTFLLSLFLIKNILSAEPLPDDFKLNIGAYIVGNQSSNIAITAHDGYSVTLDLQKILKMETEATSLYFDGYYRFTPHHRVEFGYGGVKSSAYTKYGKVYGDGTSIPIDLRHKVNTHLNVAVAKLLYTYSFYHTQDVELGLGFGIHRTEIDYALSVGIGDQDANSEFSIVIAPPIPVFGFRLDYNILKRWSVLYKIDYLSLSSKINYYQTPGIKKLSGHILDHTISTEYQFIDNISLALGINYNEMEIDFIKESYDIGLENDVVGVSGSIALYF